MSADYDLLDDIKKRIDCTYISDMHFSPNKELAQYEFEHMDLSKYPDGMREEAFQYLYWDSKSQKALQQRLCKRRNQKQQATMNLGV